MRQANACSLLVVGLLVACAGGGQAPAGSRAGESPSSPKRITAAIMGEPPYLFSRLNPAAIHIPGKDELERLVHVGAAVSDDRGRLQAQLAEAVPTLENGLWKLFADGRMQTTWVIRRNAFWHDGTPVSADDLLFTSVLSQDRELPIGRSAAYELVESIDALDSRTVSVAWKTPYIEADRLLNSPPLPKHILQRPYAEDKASLAEHPYWTHEFVGTGPFRLVEWARSSHALLEANDRYFLGRPKLDQVVVKFIPDANTLLTNVLAGTVELTMGRGLSLEQALQMRAQWKDGEPEIQLRSWIMIYPQLLQPNPSVVADVRFRRALMHAIDREQMAEALEAGISPVAHVYLNPREPEYREIEAKIVRYEYDSGKATRMIEDLGYRKGSDGGLRDLADQRLNVEIRTSGESDIHIKSIHPVSDHWRTIGVGVDSIIMPIQLQREREYVATFPAFLMYRQPNDLNSVRRYHGSQARMPPTFIGQNYNRYTNPEFNALIDGYFATIPMPERMGVLGEIVHHMTDQVLLMGLFYDTQPVMIGKRLVNAATGQGSQGWNAEQWDVR